MSDDLTDRIGTGLDADGVLTSGAFDLAFKAIESELTEAWKRSPARDQDGREKIHLALNLLLKVRTKLESMIQDGNLAQSRLTELNKPKTSFERLKESMSSWGE
jgi:hypothetical protein